MLLSKDIKEPILPEYYNQEKYVKIPENDIGVISKTNEKYECTLRSLRISLKFDESDIASSRNFIVPFNIAPLFLYSKKWELIQMISKCMIVKENNIIGFNFEIKKFEDLLGNYKKYYTKRRKQVLLKFGNPDLFKTIFINFLYFSYTILKKNARN